MTPAPDPQPSEIARQLQPVFAQRNEISAAYLFGSAAKGRLRPGSDVDIALLLAREPRALTRKALLDSLLPALGRILRRDVHFLFLNNASYLARAQVFNNGELLYVRDRKELARFRMISTALLADFMPYLRMTQQGLENRLRRGHGG
ncbi:nucleotidyltransferase domain-containing protein [Desulfurivibrio sp. D14AmB]|uniref:type VII toxin-antitoxin system MntA family adenylyltransferase antitoxin n=1 Tax=Desulfurivibrio sp. D14AmB TaxID=3374370 RepID=UPI00376EA88E